MTDERRESLYELLLTRQGIVFLPHGGDTSSDVHVRAVELELAGVGYLPSVLLRARMSMCSLLDLARFRDWCIKTIVTHAGDDRKHVPLFRRFPDGIPDDTAQLWWSKVLVHFLQQKDQPCLFCGKTGTTHVLNPCKHIVCDHCFDGGNYSACPVCEHHVDQSSPFFKDAPVPSLPEERVTFKLLDIGVNEEEEARRLFLSFCLRTQSLSPSDRDSLITLLRSCGLDVLSWLPDEIPLRENVATVFGLLLQEYGAAEVIPHAHRYVTTATDVLRLIAVFSGTDGSLQPETVIKRVHRVELPSRFWGHIANLIGAQPPGPTARSAYVPLRLHRFRVARMPRQLRRELLGMLEVIPWQQLAEDMLRHCSYWVWVGEFLHPHEYASRYPNVAQAFRILRKKAPDGTPAPVFKSWSGQVEQAILSRNVDELIAILSERPGEFGRRLDHVLRIAGQQESSMDAVVLGFVRHIPALATPMLLTLYKHLPSRLNKAPVRAFWPKGRIAKGALGTDNRKTLVSRVVEPITAAIEAELLGRFAQKTPFDTCIIDKQLGEVIVPFNERTASKAAVSLPRGSRIAVEPAKVIRLFLHWCQPQRNGERTDLDLSVAFYDEEWRYRGVCSYYELKLLTPGGSVVAQSAGDLRDAPWPDGATEFVDIDAEHASEIGARYAVMVVNSYAGMPFSLLERGFAGVMIRNDAYGMHFDPRTVELKFALDGENGVFLPLVLDLTEGMLHWLDVQSKGRFTMNNVATSNADITKLCPNLMAYFSSNLRPSLYDLGLLHAAARCDRVLIRSASVREFIRESGETHESFYSRLLHEPGREIAGFPVLENPALGLLLRGNIDLADGSHVYAIFRERITSSVAASDLLS